MSKSNKPLYAKLIFNPRSGQMGESPNQLLQIVEEMQRHNIIPEVSILEDGSEVAAVVTRAQKDGTKLVVASGGDGTIDTVAAALAGTKLTLGILPTGTSNNLALNLRIPRDLAGAVDILRNGQPLSIDLGSATSQRKKHFFLEFISLGLTTEVFPATERFRKGEITQAGELFTIVADSSPSLVTLEMDGEAPQSLAAYSVIVTNMPYIGRNFRIDRKVSFRDNRLDVFVFTELNKLGLLNYAVGYLNGEIKDESVKHFSVREVKITTRPLMAINADGQRLPDGKVTIRVLPEGLRVMAGSAKGTGPRRNELPDLLSTTNGK